MKKVILAVSIPLLALTFASCAAAESQAKSKTARPQADTKPKRAPLELNKSHNGKAVMVVVGQKIIIRLKGNPVVWLRGNMTPGYGWKLKPIKAHQAIRQEGKAAFRPWKSSPGTAGGGGVFMFTFQAVKPGKCVIALEYKRPWKKNKKPARTFTVTVTVMSAKAAERVKKLKNGIDSFTLTLQYHHGPKRDKKPYYNFTLNVQEVRTLWRNPFWPHIKITKFQAEKIIDHLATDGFLERAGNALGAKAKMLGGPRYALEVCGGTIRLYENLGWGLGMLNRLDSLQKVIDGEAEKRMTTMDKLLKRLAEHRKKWQKGAKSSGPKRIQPINDIPKSSSLLR